MSPSARHQAALPPRYPRRGFVAALLRRTGIDLGRHTIIPDAFRISRKKKLVVILEVQVTHFMDDDSVKLTKLRDLRDRLESIGWRLRVALGGPGGCFRRMDFETGRPVFTLREGRAAVRRLDFAHTLGRLLP